MTARTTDPATSHLAATYIAGKRPGLKDAFLMALKALGPSTANEIANWCVTHGVTANAESVRKRALELVRDGLAKYGQARTCKITGQQAGTLELSNEVQCEQKEHTNFDGRDSTANTRRAGQVQRHSGAVQRESEHGRQHKGPLSVSTPDTERIQAVVQFINAEREWIETWRAGMELSKVAKALGTWPMGTTEEYIRACESAAAQGLIERDGGRVRRKRAEKETKATQMGLFGDE